MPKQKTKSGAKKRFRVTASGRVKFKASHARHMQMNKPKSMKRKTKGSSILCDSDGTSVLEHWMPYAGPKKSKRSIARKKLAAAKEASRQVVNDVFALLGVNLANFDSVQAFRDDIEWARRSRKISEMTGKRIWTTIVGIASAGIAVTLWEWAHALFHKGP